jgi:hypothetical protein
VKLSFGSTIYPIDQMKGAVKLEFFFWNMLHMKIKGIAQSTQDSFDLLDFRNTRVGKTHD